MSNLGQGWISALISAQNAAISKTLETYTQRKQRERLKKRFSEERTHEEKIADQEIAFKRAEYQKKLEISQRKDRLFKDIAVYTIIIIMAVGLLTTGGVVIVKKKKGGK